MQSCRGEESVGPAGWKQGYDSPGTGCRLCIGQDWYHTGSSHCIPWSCIVGRPSFLLLDPQFEGLEDFESLMALLNLGSLNKSIRKRILKDGNCIQAIENYMFEEHQLTRCDGENDKVRI